MPIATLSVDLVARLAALEAGFDKAGRLAEKSAALIAERYSSAGASISKEFKQIFAGVGVTALTRNLLNGVDALNDFKDATGASVENASALDDVARRTGSSLESVEGILVKFNSALKEADGKNTTSQALKLIGVDAERLKKIDPAEALRQTAVALSTFADDGQKARVVQELFGKSIREAGPFLKDLAEQGRLVATVTTQQAEEVEKFNKQIFGLQANVVDLARRLSGPLVTSLNELLDKFKQFDGLKGFLKADLGLDDLGQLKSRAAALDADIKRSIDTVERLAEALVRDPGNDLLAGRLEKARTRLDGLRQDAASTADQLKRVANDLAPPDASDALSRRLARGEDTRRSVGNLPGTPSKSKREFVGPEVPQSLKDALDRIERTDVSKVARLREELDRLLSIRSAGGATAGVAQAIEEVEAELLKLDPAAQAAADRLERLNKLLDATPTAKLEEARKDMQLLAEALERGEITQEQFLEAASERLNLVAENADKAKGLAEELGLTFTSAFEDAIVSGGDFRSLLRGLEQDLLRILTRKFVTEPLANSLGDLFKGFLGGGAIANARGGAYGPAGVIPFAAGGVVDRPTLFKFAKGTGLMGEAGPEAILPLVRGKGGKLGVQMSGQGGGIVIQQTNHFSGGVNRAELASFVAANNRRLVEGLQQSRNRDGGMA